MMRKTNQYLSAHQFMMQNGGSSGLLEIDQKKNRVIFPLLFQMDSLTGRVR
jgi:hypothetical protein